MQEGGAPPYKVFIMNEGVPEGEIQAEYVRLAIKLDMVLWPFDNSVVERILEDDEYTDIEQEVEFVRATRDSALFYMDRQQHKITFDGITLKEVVDAKESFEAALKTNTGVVLNDYIAYCQSGYMLIYLAKKSIDDVLADMYKNSDDMKSIHKIVGKSVRPYCIEVSSRGSHHQKTWFKIKIEPKIEGTGKTYFCSAIYRDVSFSSVIDDAKGAKKVVKRLLCMLEGKMDEGSATRA